MKKIILPVVATAVLTALLTVLAVQFFSKEPVFLTDTQDLPVHYASTTIPPATQPVDFSSAAESAVPAVVHITTLIEGKTVIAQDPYNPFWGFGREFRTPNQLGSGSGVIISPDGYIVTNNHVVQGVDKVQVTFNNRNRQIAKVIGTDPATDLAVIKIEGTNLPYMTLGNSDNVKLGQWVLAVGYPLNLDCTVTAGIVSAKGRSIGINRRHSNQAIENFIQTDAAVNPGNSGGALVNTEGHLIGINSAIASPTGSYAGYAYAIPSNIVKKVAEDIIKYGKVERGYLGVQLIDLNKINLKMAQELGISQEDYKNTTGVYIHDVVPGSGADKAGLQKGDFITKLNGVNVHSSPQLIGQVARFSPGEKIALTFRRDGKSYETDVTLQGDLNEEKLLASNNGGGSGTFLGAQVQVLPPATAKELNVNGGLLVKALNGGVLQKQTNIRPGFVIFSINDQPVQSIAEAEKVVASSQGSLQISGVYPGKSGVYYYGFPYRP